MLNRIINLLCCPRCHGELQFVENSCHCEPCHQSYQIIEGVPLFAETSIEQNSQEIGDPLILKLKTFFKSYEKLYHGLVSLFGALFVGEKKGKDAVCQLPEKSIIINLASGPRIIDKKIINVDNYKFRGVRVVADALHLPFKDAAIDGVICESSLEHMIDPLQVIKEIERILKKGGLIYISVPFMDAYHSAPDDYYRWTVSGLREVLSNFNEKELKIAWGPTSTLNSALANWLGIALSFGNKTIYQVWTLLFMLVLSPLKLLDFIFRYYKFSSNASVGFYFIGTKK